MAGKISFYSNADDSDDFSDSDIVFLGANTGGSNQVGRGAKAEPEKNDECTDSTDSKK